MSTRTRLLVTTALLGSTTAASAAPPPTPAPRRPPPAPVVFTPASAAARAARWTAPTPEAMTELAFARARRGGPDTLAALTLLATMADRAAPGSVAQKIAEIGRGPGPIAEQAKWLAASLAPDTRGAQPEGLITKLALLGPFQDTGGRLKERDIAEGEPRAWGDPNADFSWGVYEVRWRPVAPVHATARGVPLDVYIAPRKESCTYLASRLTVNVAGPLVVHLAASGAVRLLWDGQEIGKSDELNEGALFDRLGARLNASAGDHVLAAKVCAGAPDDEGRVRLRVTPEAGASFEQSNDFRPLASASFAKVAFRPVREPLATAVEAGVKPAVEALLAAAVVRTKAGADDLRSPRAPGLLDALARDPNAPADRLALVGWVSAFGAQRSGWLNAARDKAVATGDAETADFAARRVAVARADAGLGDWALAALAPPPFANATDPEAAMLRAYVRAEVGGDAARRVEVATLMKTVEAEGPRASAALWGEVAHLARGLDPRLELRARQRLTEIEPERFDADYVRATAAIGGGDDVTRAAVATIARGGVTDGEDFERVAANLRQAGRVRDERDYLAVANRLAPNLGPLVAELAETLYASGDPADRAVGDRALVRARDLDPGDAKKRAEVALREGDGRGEPARPRDERWMLAPETFRAAAKARPARAGEVADRQLHWVRAVTMYDDRRVSQLIHYSREIVIAPRTVEELYEQLPVEGESVELIRARVYRANGDVAFAEEQKSDQGRPMVRWPELKPGDIVEVALRNWTSGPVGGRGDAPFFFMDYAGAPITHPILYNEVVVDSPKVKPIAVDVLHGKPDRLLRADEGARQVVRYIWDKPPLFADEPLAPKASEIYPTLVGSTFATWADFRAWYQGAVEGFTRPDEQVRRLAEELTRGKASREEKLRAIFDFVADDIRYVNYTSGEWWLPNRPQQLLARRQGDCDDKAILLITLLKCVGIEATEVLIQTRYTRQPSVLLSQGAAIPLFDHGIAYLPPKNGAPAAWLDATSPESRLGPVPSMDVRTFALFANEGPAKMTPTPAGSIGDYGFTADWVLKLDRDGGAELTADERHRGDQAFLLRTNLREKDARAQWVEQNLIAGWVSQAQVDKDVDFQPLLPRGEARVKYRATSRALGRREGDDLVVTLAPTSTLTSHLAPLPTRTLPVALPVQLAPSSQVQVVHIVAPEGMRPADLPPGGEEAGGEFGRAKLELAIDAKNPGTVVLTRTVAFDLDLIPVEKYGAWRRWLSRVDSLLHRSVRFVPAARAESPVRAPSAVEVRP